MKEVLYQSGIRNYTIWTVKDKLFGYYEWTAENPAATYFPYATVLVPFPDFALVAAHLFAAAL